MEKYRRSATAIRISRAAKEAMLEWKDKTGIKAIISKTKNQKLEMKIYNKHHKKMDAHEARKMSHGRASAVRHIKPEDKT